MPPAATLYPINIQSSGSLPEKFPSPLSMAHPLAVQAAKDLQKNLKVDQEGKMFGVLVVQLQNGKYGYIAGFSGMRNQSWFEAGFVPPTFTERYLQLLERDGPQITALQKEIATLEQSVELLQFYQLSAKHHQIRLRAQEENTAKKAKRRLARENATKATSLLSAESKKDKLEWKLLKSTLEKEIAPLKEKATKTLKQIAALKKESSRRSRELLPKMQATYAIANSHGKRTTLKELFHGQVPGGAGDCAGIKLLQYALENGMKPLAMAEFWWGPPSASHVRRHGEFYPSCRGKCAPILDYMLKGIPHEEAPSFASKPEATISAVFEDKWLIAIEKPHGLLSVPGRHKNMKHSAQSLLEDMFSEAKLIHRLDLDTSGLLLAAKQKPAYVAMQRLFSERKIHKHYTAVVEGVVTGKGLLSLPLTLDVNDRPRQIHAPSGKQSITEWECKSTDQTFSRLALIPKTGRTHQLRVHCSHPLGLNAPIVGDRLYGNQAERMLLHADAIRFLHPMTKNEVSITSKVPF